MLLHMFRLKSAGLLDWPDGRQYKHDCIFGRKLTYFDSATQAMADYQHLLFWHCAIAALQHASLGESNIAFLAPLQVLFFEKMAEI